MDDAAGKITELLSDPLALENIRKMASGLLGSAPDTPSPITETPTLPDVDIGKLMGVLGKMKQTQEDNRSRLLLALKPHLSERRRERVDNAVKILKILDMLPLLKESGLLNIL